MKAIYMTSMTMIESGGNGEIDDDEDDDDRNITIKITF